MTENITYDISSTHVEEIRGAITSTPFRFFVAMSDDQPQTVSLSQYAEGELIGSLEFPVSILDRFSVGLEEIIALVDEAGARVTAARVL